MSHIIDVILWRARGMWVWPLSVQMAFVPYTLPTVFVMWPTFSAVRVRAPGRPPVPATTRTHTCDVAGGWARPRVCPLQRQRQRTAPSHQPAPHHPLSPNTRLQRISALCRKPCTPRLCTASTHRRRCDVGRCKLSPRPCCPLSPFRCVHPSSPSSDASSGHARARPRSYPVLLREAHAPNGIRNAHMYLGVVTPV